MPRSLDHGASFTVASPGIRPGSAGPALALESWVPQHVGRAYHPGPGLWEPAPRLANIQREMALVGWKKSAPVPDSRRPWATRKGVSTGRRALCSNSGASRPKETHLATPKLGNYQTALQIIQLYCIGNIHMTFTEKNKTSKY